MCHAHEAQLATRHDKRALDDSLSQTRKKSQQMIRYPHTALVIANALLALPIASAVAAANVPCAARESCFQPSDRLDHIHAWLQSLVDSRTALGFMTSVSQPDRVRGHLARARQGISSLTVQVHAKRVPWPREEFVRWAFATFALAATGGDRVDQLDVVTAARAYGAGGGFNVEWKGSGTPRPIEFQGKRLLAKGDGTYCCGYTFTVAMDVAESRDLLKGKTFAQIRRFQKDWYGVSKESKETLCVHAVKVLGIGEAVDHRSAKAGDMVQFWRKNGSGHSVMFLNWIERNGKRIGLRYRSSQTGTDGIGDRTEYFSDSTEKANGVDRKRTYFCRLNEQGQR